MYHLNIACTSLTILLILFLLKIKDIRQIKSFLIAERQYSNSVVVAIITTTLISGGVIIGTVESIFQYSILFYFSLFGIIISIFIVSEFIASKISTFYDCISIGDVICKTFGQEAKIFIGCISLLQSIMMFAIQINALGYILSYFYNINFQAAIIASTIIILFFSISGGIKLAITTDIIQFGILMVAIPMICNIGLLQVGGYISLFQALPDHFLYLDVSEYNIPRYLGLFLTFAVPTCGPATIQRLLVTQNTEQAIRAFRYSAIIIFIYYFLIMLIALSVSILEPDIESILIIPFLIDNFLPIIVKIVAMVGLSIIIIISANSILNAGSVSLIHDVLQSLYPYPFKTKTENILAVLTSFIIAILGIFFAINFSTIIEILLYANELWSPIVLVPLIAAIYKIKVEKLSFFVSTFMGLLTVLIWKYWNLEENLNINATLPGVIVNFVTMSIFSYFKYVTKLPSKNI